MKRLRVKGRHVVLSFVCLVLGFIISFSYQYAKEEAEQGRITDRQWNREFEIRDHLNRQKERNLELQQDLYEKQEQIREIEEDLANKEKEQIYFNLVEDVEKLRMYTGEVKVKGPGVKVTLEDASYAPSGEDVNNYLVHESHLFKVINELLISGAQAISVNGRRLTHNTYLYCDGPVITIDGTQYPAPFTISAIGDPEVLIPALNINGGINDQLVQDNIVVTIERAEVVMEPILKADE